MAEKQRASFIGSITEEMCARTDLSELSMCRGRPERCSLPPGEHDRQEAAERDRRKDPLLRQREVSELKRPAREVFILDFEEQGHSLYFWADGLVTWKPDRPA